MIEIMYEYEASRNANPFVESLYMLAALLVELRGVYRVTNNFCVDTFEIEVNTFKLSKNSFVDPQLQIWI